MFKRAREGAAIVGRDGCIHWTNDAYAEVTGRVGNDDVCASIFLTLSGSSEANATIREALIFGSSIEVISKAKTGQVSLRFLPLEDELGRAPSHLVLIHDEAAAQAASSMSVRLTNNEVHLKALEDLVPGVLFQLERSFRGRHRFTHVGARCESVLGVTAAALEERVDRLFDVINGEDLRDLKNALEKSRAELSPLSWTGRTTPHDGPSRWIQITARAVGQEDQSVRWHGMISDISHQKEMQRRVESHERLASVGELAAGVAHEINNPLAYVLANIRIALDDLEAQANLPETWTQDAAVYAMQRNAMQAVITALHEAEGGACRVNQIVRDLKQLSRPTAGNVSAVDIEEVIQTSASIAMSHIRQVAQLDIDVDVHHAALGNEARLTQVVLNLLVNAAQAIAPGNVNENRIVVRGRSDSENITIEVIDSGVGIAADVIERIYEPFFTTKSESGGTGLGLAMVHNIVREHGGRLEVESRVGKGSCFRIVLAVAPEEMLTREHPPRVLTPPRARPRFELQREEKKLAHHAKSEPKIASRVLVIDDEPALVRAIARQLRGHDVSTADGGRKAREILKRDTMFDVVLCDLMMPDCTGMELYREVMAYSPAQADRFIFMTGGVFTDEAREFLADTNAQVLEKPFEFDAIKSAVKHVIEENATLKNPVAVRPKERAQFKLPPAALGMHSER